MRQALIACLLLAPACTSPSGPAQGPGADLAATADLAAPPGDLSGADLAPQQDGGLSGLDDEFGDPATLSGYSDLLPDHHDLLRISEGRLTVTPVTRQHTHWFSDNRGVLLYKTVRGDFLAEVDVTVSRRDDPAQAPRGSFSSAGLLVRDPASRNPGGERWAMYNLGHQTGALAREVKTTRPGNGGASLSTLYLIPSGGRRGGKLRVCRLGPTLHFFHQHPGESGWTEEAYGEGTMPQGNGAGEPTPGVVDGGTIRFHRPDLPETLQVGLMAGHWEGALELRADFDYVRFRPAATLDDCRR